MAPPGSRSVGRAGVAAGRWPEVVFGLVPAAVLLAFCLYLLTFVVVLSLGDHAADDLIGSWKTGLTLSAVLGGLSCLSLLRAFRLNLRAARRSYRGRRLLSAGLVTGPLVSAGSVTFLLWAGLSISPPEWLVIVFLFVSPAVVALRYLVLLYSPGESS